MRQALRATVSLSVEQVREALAQPSVPARPPVLVHGVTTDSRDVEAGDLFVALKGAQDGHAYIPAALERGAAALLVEQASHGTSTVPVLRVDDTLAALGRLAHWWRRSCGAQLVAVTGSNGKTTTKEMIAAVLTAHTGDRARVLVTPGNFNNFIGLPLTLLGGRPDQTVGVVELGMNAPGEIFTLTGIADPEVGVITNAADAHLERFGDVSAVARAKAELWDRMSGDAVAVVPTDDSHLGRLAASLHRGACLTFGTREDADVRLIKAAPVDRGLAVTLRAQGEVVETVLPLLGRHNGLNAAAACAAALAVGVAPGAIAEGLANTAAMPHRARLLSVDRVAVLDDCYNANPASVRAAAQVLLDLPGRGRAGVVIADMLELGAASASLHREIGRDLVMLGVEVVVGLGPHCVDLCAGAREAGAAEVEHVTTVQAAAAAAHRRFTAGDRVLIKGSRGMGLELVIAAWEQTARSGAGER